MSVFSTDYLFVALCLGYKREKDDDGHDDGYHDDVMTFYFKTTEKYNVIPTLLMICAGKKGTVLVFLRYY